jgi:outer membrane protein OmpA-like peptidoglycan-associated protein
MHKHLLFFFGVFLFHSLYTFGQDTLTSSFYFESASAEISEIDKNNFQLQVGKLTNFELKSLEIYGYCDDLGSEEKNLELSNKRAQMVRSLIYELYFPNIAQGKTEGKGEIALSNFLKVSVDVQRRQNRRVDVVFVYEVVESEVTVVNLTPPVKESQLTKKLKVGDKVTLRNILFIGGRDILLPESYESLDELIFFMKKYPEYSITILGHVCCQNDGQDGMDNDTQIRNLSLVRARRIYDILVEKGISKNRLDYKGMKGNYPTGLGEEADRRVEIEISAIHP